MLNMHMLIRILVALLVCAKDNSTVNYF